MKKLIYLLASAILAGLLIGCTPTVSSCCMHSATKENIIKSPTCTETGVKTYTCEDCGEVLKTEDIEALGHTFEDDAEVVATCTTKGHTSHTCTVCGVTEELSETEASGHNYTSEISLPPKFDQI